MAGVFRHERKTRAVFVCPLCQKDFDVTEKNKKVLSGQNLICYGDALEWSYANHSVLPFRSVLTPVDRIAAIVTSPGPKDAVSTTVEKSPEQKRRDERARKKQRSFKRKVLLDFIGDRAVAVSEILETFPGAQRMLHGFIAKGLLIVTPDFVLTVRRKSSRPLRYAGISKEVVRALDGDITVRSKK